MNSVIVHRGRWTREDRAAQPYRYLPFDVPAGSAALAITLRYDRDGGVLDLGCLGPAAFRGWSGGARSAVAIGIDRATPGYLPGPLAAGSWQVLLGLHRVGRGGLEWTVTTRTGRSAEVLAAEIGADLGAPLPAVAARRRSRRLRPARRDLPAAPGLRWLAGDLHAHTVHSDGALTVPELAALGYDRGLDFVAVTDHNTISQHAELAAAGAAAGVVLVPGQEVTTDLGHANAFGDIGWIDFRQPADAWLAETDRRGGILSVNHPLAADCAWRQPMTGRPPLAEIWHWTWLDRRWGGPLAWWLAWHPGAAPVGGSDFHQHGSDAPPGSPTTWVACAADRLDSDPAGAVLDGLRAGRVAVNAGTADPALLRVDGELVVVGADGLLLVDAAGRRTPVRADRATLAATEGPVRLEDHDGAVVALCAPA
jgi:hypothetical protein